MSPTEHNLEQLPAELLKLKGVHKRVERGIHDHQTHASKVSRPAVGELLGVEVRQDPHHQLGIPAQRVDGGDCQHRFGDFLPGAFHSLGHGAVGVVSKPQLAYDSAVQHGHDSSGDHAGVNEPQQAVEPAEPGQRPGQ